MSECIKKRIQELEQQLKQWQSPDKPLDAVKDKQNEATTGKKVQEFSKQYAKHIVTGWENSWIIKMSWVKCLLQTKPVPDLNKLQGKGKKQEVSQEERENQRSLHHKNTYDTIKRQANG